MGNLYILGNGFDIAHKIPTSYCNFKKYLWEQAYSRKRKKSDDFWDRVRYLFPPKLPPMQIHIVNGTLSNHKAECRMAYWLINKAAKNAHDMDWNQFESLLDDLDFALIIRRCKRDENVASILAEVLSTLNRVFFEWVCSIDIPTDTKTKSGFSKLIDAENDLAVSFNYTDTLEKLYGFKKQNIRYLHGRRETDIYKRIERADDSWGEDNIPLILGHEGKRGNELYDMMQNGELPEVRVPNSKIEQLKHLYVRMLKDSKWIVYENKDFIQQISCSDVQKVFSYGFSYSQVDELQIHAICDALNNGINRTESMTWYFTDFDKEKNNVPTFMEYVKKCGFLGKFDVFSPEEN